MRVKIVWATLSEDDFSFEDYYGMSFEEFSAMTEEERDDLEMEVVNSIRDEIVPLVKRVEYYDIR